MANPIQDSTERNEAMLKRIKDRQQRRREHFEKLSSDEKFEQLMEYIDWLDERISFNIRLDILALERRFGGIDIYLNALEQVLKQKFNILLSRNDETVSTEKILCKAKAGETHTAIILVHRDGTTSVKCSGECYDCKWGSPEW